MSAPWPLSARLLLGLSEDIGDARLRTSMTSGLTKMRRLTTTSIRTIRGEILVTGADRELLIAWGKVTLAEWTLPFTWTDPATRESIDYAFATVPAFAPLANGDLDKQLWRVAFALEAAW